MGLTDAAPASARSAEESMNWLAAAADAALRKVRRSMIPSRRKVCWFHHLFTLPLLLPTQARRHRGRVSCSGRDEPEDPSSGMAGTAARTPPDQMRLQQDAAGTVGTRRRTVGFAKKLLKQQLGGGAADI